MHHDCVIRTHGLSPPGEPEQQADREHEAHDQQHADDQAQPPLPAYLPVELESRSPYWASCDLLVPELHRHTFRDVLRAGVPPAGQVLPAHLARIEQRHLTGIDTVPVRRVPGEARRHQVGLAPEAHLQRQGDVVPAARARVAMHRQRNAVDTLVAQDLVFERVARVERANQRHVPVPVGPAALTLHPDFGAGAARLTQHLAGNDVALAPLVRRVERHRGVGREVIGLLDRRVRPRRPPSAARARRRGPGRTSSGAGCWRRPSC